MAGALQGIRVLDLSRFIAGPFCAMQLGDMGADVVKVERPGGEDTRSIEPQVNGESLYALTFNRNKRGITIDFRHPEARELLHALAAQADVLVENFRPGTLEKMGCSWDELHRLNPRLVVVRISGFGQDGPYAQRPCFDVVAQAMSGLMEMTGAADGPPTMAGTFLVDYSTGLYATIGALGALQARERSGLGQLVDVALLDSAVSLLITAIPEYLLLGQAATRHGSRDRYTAPANAFRTRDGDWVLISTGNDTLFPRFAQAAGLARLLDDPRFADAKARMANADAIEAEVQAWCDTQATEHILALMERAEVPCAKIATIPDVVANPQLRHRQQIVELEHPRAGRFPTHGVTVKWSQTPGEITRPAPSVGEHNVQVLHDWLGWSDERIEQLRARRVV